MKTTRPNTTPALHRHAPHLALINRPPVVARESKRVVRNLAASTFLSPAGALRKLLINLATYALIVASAALRNKLLRNFAMLSVLTSAAVLETSCASADAEQVIGRGPYIENAETKVWKPLDRNVRERRVAMTHIDSIRENKPVFKLKVKMPDGTRLEIDYVRAGDPTGPRVILFHGSPGSWWCMHNHMIKLARMGYDVVSFSAPSILSYTEVKEGEWLGELDKAADLNRAVTHSLALHLKTDAVGNLVTDASGNYVEDPRGVSAICFSYAANTVGHAMMVFDDFKIARFGLVNSSWYAVNPEPIPTTDDAMATNKFTGSVGAFLGGGWLPGVGMPSKVTDHLSGLSDEEKTRTTHQALAATNGRSWAFFMNPSDVALLHANACAESAVNEYCKELHARLKPKLEVLKGIPMVLVIARDDQMIPANTQLRLAEELTKLTGKPVRVVVIDNVGHYATLFQAAALEAQLKAFQELLPPPNNPNYGKQFERDSSRTEKPDVETEWKRGSKRQRQDRIASRDLQLGNQSFLTRSRA